VFRNSRLCCHLERRGRYSRLSLTYLSIPRLACDKALLAPSGSERLAHGHALAEYIAPVLPSYPQYDVTPTSWCGAEASSMGPRQLQRLQFFRRRTEERGKMCGVVYPGKFRAIRRDTSAIRRGNSGRDDSERNCSTHSSFYLSFHPLLVGSNAFAAKSVAIHEAATPKDCGNAGRADRCCEPRRLCKQTNE
jgi:hypothetical protein